LDAAALALLQPQGLEYGTWRADNFLRDEAVRHMQSRPGWFIAPTLKRFWRVTTLQKPPEAATNLPGTVASASRIAGPFLLPLAALGLWLARGSPLLRNLLLVAWLSRVLPFSFLRDELRFEILIVAVYVVLLAVVVDEALTRAGGVRPADQEPRAVA
ncbi:MAG TPA: hypothetical protein VJB57_12705, partial [Dehalococcoidia bacterium]|nr:hypothetical protein [Dehalococcoidia bacterium]